MTMFASQWLANPDTGYEIDQSIRFNEDDSAKLTGGTGQTGDGTQWTISMWIKRGSIDANFKTIWSAGDGSNKRALSRFVSGGAGQASEDIGFSIRTGGSWYELYVNRSFRDPSAWYHFVWVWDSDNATASDRMRIYVNGERLTSFTNTPSYPASGTATDSWNNSSYAHQIGFENNTRFFDGYLAEIYHIDGQALTPTSFGETDSNTGQWVPIDASGLTFGTRGFYLKGEDSSDLGNDSSGNNNDFTSSGLAAADQMSDSPTDNFCTLNPIQQDATGLSDGNLQFTTSSTGTHKMASATIAQSSGKWYCEVTCNAALGSNARIGIIPDDNDNYSGSDGHVGDDAASFAYVDNGQQESNNSQSSYGASYANGDVIAMALNLDDDEITFYKNGSSQGAISITAGKDYRFAASQFNAGGMAFNFGQASFSATPPTGFKALSTANLPGPTIADSSAYFQTTLYTGNASTQEVNQSGNSTFEPGFVWIKTRSNAASHALFDQVRGVNKQLRSDSNGAEYTAYSDLLTAFDADGFTLGADATVNNVNVNTYTYASWQWATDGTSGSSNTDGDITSTVSASPTSGVAVLTYSGNGSDNQTIGHGLGIAPKMILTKRRDAAGSNWTVYHDAVGINKVLYLNLTNAVASNTEQYRATPTSSVYTIGVGGDINNSSGTYVAYVFAEVEGFSKISSFEGNSNADGTFVYTGFKPAFILTKNIDTADQWGIRDAVRNPFNVTDKLLNPNASTAETTSSTGYIDILSNGFKARSSDSNINSNTIIYYAVAESPFKTANAQ